jgi:hypothetical protein
MKIIAVCSSANFYRQAVDVQTELEARGYKAIIPINAERMKESGDFDPSHYRTWLKDANDYHKKTALMRLHFTEIEKADSILVLNFEKHGVDNYIGGNVLIEMALAFYLHKPVYIFNDIPKESPFLEEIIAMQPIVMHGDINKLEPPAASKK